ncbi:reverse transcriptase domain-containing protein, partial [Streptomyces sp. IBSBF 2390]|uniref:reverse transcriptase domain-containing protein n=1 Tax=Streptomyces sp. IBSBF 2390 TaxID=2903533 RepID=UPI002FDBD533
LSPLLCLLVVNGILKTFDSKVVKVVAYADDVAIILPGHDPRTICKQMTQALKTLKDWTSTCGLSIHPSKTELIMFTKRKLPADLVYPELDEVSKRFVDKAKYLGVIIDSKLTWKDNAMERVKKSINAFYACRSAFGKSWGLSPKIILWIYKAIIRPILMYGAIVWWHSL